MPDITWVVTRWTTGDDYPADVYHTYIPGAEACWGWEAVRPDGADVENGYAATPEVAMAAAEAWRREWGQGTVWQEAVYTADLDADWIANVYLEYDGSWVWERGRPGRGGGGVGDVGMVHVGRIVVAGRPPRHRPRYVRHG